MILRYMSVTYYTNKWKDTPDYNKIITNVLVVNDEKKSNNKTVTGTSISNTRCHDDDNLSVLFIPFERIVWCHLKHESFRVISPIMKNWFCRIFQLIWWSWRRRHELPTRRYIVEYSHRNFRLSIFLYPASIPVLLQNLCV